MEPYVITIAQSPWFSLIGGLASMLGCLLAVYPVQVAQIPPSVYRGMVWQKALLWSCGIGLMVLAGIQFYMQVPPGSDTPLGQILGQVHNFVHGLPRQFQTDLSEPYRAGLDTTAGVGEYGVGSAGTAVTDPRGSIGNVGGGSASPVGTVQTYGVGNVKSLSPSGVNRSSGSGANPPNPSSVGNVKSQHLQAGSLGSFSVSGGSTGSSAGLVSGGTGSVTVTSPVNTGSVQVGPGGNVQVSGGNFQVGAGNIGDAQHGPQIWGLLFVAGTILFVIGIWNDPFARVVRRLSELENTLEDKRIEFLKSIARLDAKAQAKALEKYDCREELVQNLLMGILTGQSVSPLRALGQNATYADLLSTAAAFLTASQRQGRTSDGDETNTRAPATPS